MGLWLFKKLQFEDAMVRGAVLVPCSGAIADAQTEHGHHDGVLSAESTDPANRMLREPLVPQSFLGGWPVICVALQ